MNTILQDYLKEYLDFCEYRKHLSYKTLKAYRIDLSQYSSYCNDSNNFFELNQVDSFITFLHMKYQSRTIKRKIASLKAFFNYMEYKSIITENPFNKLNIRFREEKLLPNVLFHFHNQTKCICFKNTDGLY